MSALVNQFEPAAAGVWADLQLNAPTLVDYEFMSAIRQQVLRRRIEETDVADALIAFDRLSVKRHSAHRLVSRMWDMRHNITPYDASYVALAEALDVPLLTADSRLAQAARAYCDVIDA